MSVSLGPSSASRWLKCTASPGFLEREKDRLVQEEADYSREGNEAHEYADAALKCYGLYDYDLIEDPEMREHIRGYVDYVLTKVQPEDTLLTEQKLPLFYMPGRNGKVDVAIVSKDSVDITDLKYGKGVSVEAVDNPQCAIYARNVIEDLHKRGFSLPATTTVKINIWQPRARDGRVHRDWELTLAELYNFCEPIAKTASEIQQNPDGGVFYPDPEKVCKFCDGKPICEAYAQQRMGSLPEGVTTIQAIVPKSTGTTALPYPAPQSLTLEQVSKILLIKDDFVSWLTSVETYANGLSLSGTRIPGFKVVEGKGGHRKWTDEKEAERILKYRLSKYEIYPRQIISPAQAEKLLKSKDVTSRLKNLLEQVITKPPGGPTLVPESDPRLELMVDPTKEFENLTETDSLL